jgi:hypothetical protein
MLKKVGGGYIFIHRMLLDYFADLPQSTTDGKTAGRSQCRISNPKPLAQAARHLTHVDATAIAAGACP